MFNTMISIAVILFVALAILIEHRLNRRRREIDKKVVSEILLETKNEIENSAYEELAPTATGRQKVRDMLDRSKQHSPHHNGSQSTNTISTIKDTLVEQDHNEPPLPDPFAADINTKKE